MSLIVNIVNNVAQPRSTTSFSQHIIKLSASTLPTTIVCLFVCLLCHTSCCLLHSRHCQISKSSNFCSRKRPLNAVIAFQFEVFKRFSSAIISRMWNTRCTKPIPYLYYLAVDGLHRMFVYWKCWPILFRSWYLVLVVMKGVVGFPAYTGLCCPQ